MELKTSIRNKFLELFVNFYQRYFLSSDILSRKDGAIASVDLVKNGSLSMINDILHLVVSHF